MLRRTRVSISNPPVPPVLPEVAEADGPAAVVVPIRLMVAYRGLRDIDQQVPAAQADLPSTEDLAH
jgi:hypothetical protein